MTKSMTAYARSSQATPFGRLTIEIQSVNRKILDVHVYMPKELFRFEVDLRKWVAEAIERGQITLRVGLQWDQGSKEGWKEQAAQLKVLKESWDAIASEVGCSKQDVDLRFLIDQLQRNTPVQGAQEEAPLRDALRSTLQETLAQLKGMKEQEGKALSQDILKRIEWMRQTTQAIEMGKELPVKKFQQKIRERLAEISTLSSDFEEKIAREVALMAEKIDITEEIVRLYSHFDQVSLLLSSRERSIGRTLDFLVQEMNREINTMGSKAQDTDVSTLVVKMKGELEKIREQAQNIE